MRDLARSGTELHGFCDVCANYGEVLYGRAHDYGQRSDFIATLKITLTDTTLDGTPLNSGGGRT